MLALNADDQIDPSKAFRTASAPLTPNVVPASGTISRCQHGVYIPAGEVRAPYCSYCSPGGPANQREEVVLPRSSGDPLNTSSRVAANKHADGSCPQCGSVVYVRVNEKGSDANRICADCETHYKVRVRKTLRQLAEEAGVSLDV